MDSNDIPSTSPEQPPPGAASPGASAGPMRHVPWALVAILMAGLAARQLIFVNQNAVNVLYWDQWDFYRPMFENRGWWDTFSLQHGPHREGLGLVLTRAIASMSEWNSRWDALAACLILIGAAVLGIALAMRFGLSRRPILLAAVPLIFTNAHEYEIFVGAVNLSYAAVPIALFMAYCLSWLARDRAWRLGAVTVLTFLLVFTGFGMFVGLLSPVLLALEALQAWRAGERRHLLWASAALALVCAAWGLFARGYTFQPAIAGFHFPYERPVEYAVFVARMLGHFYGTPLLSRGELVFGACVAALLAAIAVWNGIRCALHGVEREPRSVVLFCLAAYSLLFCVNCAVGRVFNGTLAPYSSRYVALLIPAALAIYLQAGVLSQRRFFLWLTLAYTAFLVPATAFPRPYELWGTRWYTEGKTTWKAEYLRTHDQAAADKAAHFPIYPGNLDSRLKYLEERRLNLFLPPEEP